MKRLLEADLIRLGSRLALLVTVLSVPAAAEVQEALLPGGAAPGATATIFAPGLVSGDGREYGVAVDKDWSEIYFTRQSGEESVIMVARRVGETWSPATPAVFSGQHNDSHPWLAPGGDQLSFVSLRPCPGAAQALNVWVVARTDDGWTEPSHLGSPVTNQTVHAPSVSASGTIYATGLIRLRHVDGQYLPAERLAPDIKGSHPAIAPDEDFLVFNGRREGGYNRDLFVVFRTPDGSWTPRVNLGQSVSSDRNESSPTLSSDGRLLFFSRDDDVWWVTATVVEAARPSE